MIKMKKKVKKRLIYLTYKSVQSIKRVLVNVYIEYLNTY